MNPSQALRTAFCSAFCRENTSNTRSSSGTLLPFARHFAAVDFVSCMYSGSMLEPGSFDPVF